MDKNLKDTIIRMIQELNESDDKFLRQLRILIIKHLDRKGRR